MKKVLIFLGSARKKFTFGYCQKFLDELGPKSEIEGEFVFLHQYSLKPCIGCKLCLDKGEEYCPLNDDRDVLLEKINNSDAIIFATPNYSFQVSGIMKIFLDRFGFMFHRPRYFTKTYTNIVVQGIYGGSAIVKYLNFIGNGLGFRTLKGICLQTLEPMDEKTKKKNEKIVVEHARKFNTLLSDTSIPKPSLFSLILFRMSRSSMKVMLDASSCDYRYYNERGWFRSEYYYPVPLNWSKKIVGNLFDRLAKKISK